MEEDITEQALSLPEKDRPETPKEQTERKRTGLFGRVCQSLNDYRSSAY